MITYLPCCKFENWGAIEDLLKFYKRFFGKLRTSLILLQWLKKKQVPKASNALTINQMELFQ